MAISPFEIVKSLNEKTSLDYDIKEYNSWMINRALSFNVDTIHFANVMNQYYNLDKGMQRDFYKFGIPKGKRYGKWEKALKLPEIIDQIAAHFCINKHVASQYYELFDAEQLKQLQEKMSRGGT